VTSDVTQAQRAQQRFSYKPALDGLRAAAVVAVMAYHFGASWAPGGFLGVDLFFVLSGYLITSLLVVEWDTTSTVHFAAFWARRARRLLPALFLVLIAISIWAALEVHSDQLGTIRWDSIWTLFYGANWRFIASGQSYFDLFRDPSPLRHTWSLAIEEQFYLVWPLVTFLCLWAARGRRWLLVSACVLGIVTSTVLMSRWYQSGDPSRSYYGTDTRAGQLLLGALLGLALIAWSPRNRAARAGVQAAGLIGAAFCFWAFVSVGDRESWLYHGGFLLFAAAAALVIAAAIQSWSPLHSVLSLRPVRWIGAISYGLYLWHWPVRVAVTADRPFFGAHLTGWTLALVRIGLTVGAATLSYYFLELPIRRGVMLRGRVAQIVAPVAGVVTAVVIVVATIGATAPPDFLVGQPTAAKPKLAPTPTVPLSASESELGVSRVLLLGDSVAATLGDALQQEAATHGVALSVRTRPGCGMTTAIPLLDDGSQFPWGQDCANNTIEYQTSSVREVNPDVVLWLSTWETANALFNGVPTRFGTPAGDAALLNEFEAARARIGKDGARLVMLTVPPHADTSELHPFGGNDASRAQYLHLNRVLRQFAKRHPDDVAVADLASIVCTKKDSCPASVDGVVLRPRDGGHFEGDGPAWVAPRLYAEVIRALSAMPRPLPSSPVSTTVPS